MPDIRKLASAALFARRSSGKSVFGQISELLRLRCGASKLGASEYYQFELYDDSRFSYPEKEAFQGWRGRRHVDQVFNLERWHSVTSDKVINSLLLERLNLPCPKIVAVFDEHRRFSGDITTLADGDELRRFLIGADYPLFVKPIDAALGRGSFLVEGFNQDENTLELAFGLTIEFEKFLQRCEDEGRHGTGGYVFQQVLKPATEIAALTGGRLAGLRMIVLVQGANVTLTHSIIKIPTGQNVTDNFDGGAQGNLLGRIGAATGAVEEVFGLEHGRYTSIRHHPDTKAPLLGFTIPNWDSYPSLVCKAARAFPGLRLQHWDVAITATGPVLLELNVHGCLELPQIAYGSGFLNGAIRDAYLEIGRTNSHSTRDAYDY